MKRNLLPVFLTLTAGLFGAEITVPHLELANRGSAEDGNFGICSSLEADIALSGGYKYGIKLGLGAEIPNLEKALSYGRLELPYIGGSANPGSADQADVAAMREELNDRYNNQASISIRSVEATIRELFGKAVDLSFFTGHYDKLGSGDEFEGYFGTVPVGTAMKGFFYYPDGLGGDRSLRFNGAVHTILGTGLAFKAAFRENIIAALYVYHDLSFPGYTGYPTGGNYSPGHYSGDARILINGETAKFEFFAGTTYVNHDDPIFRGSALAYFSSGPMGFLMQAGVPYWEAGESLTIDNCYFLLEPRLRFEKVGANLTFFYHPLYYMNRMLWDKNEKDNGRADINIRVFYGNLTLSAFEAGLESTLGLKVHNGENLTLWLSPFVSAAVSGLSWDFKVRFNPLYFVKNDDQGFMEAFIGIRTSY